MLNPGTGTAPKLVLQARDGVGELALELAEKFAISSRPAERFPILPQLKALERDIQAAHQQFEAAARAQQPDISPAAEWLLDNFHIVRQAFQQIRIGMPADYYSRLPKVNLQNGLELARIYLLASTLASFYESRLDAENITGFIQAYQTVSPLKTGEIWALALMLRLGILEMLAVSLANIQHTRPNSTYPLPVFQFDAEAGAGKSSRLPAADETIVSNCILSLRLLDTQDWQTFFENTSLVEARLRNDPSGAYPLMSFNTRNQYRNVIEDLALGSKVSEEGIAQQALNLAGQGDSKRKRHVGFYLVGPGREELEAGCGYRIPGRKRLYRWGLRHWFY